MDHFLPVICAVPGMPVSPTGIAMAVANLDGELLAGIIVVILLFISAVRSGRKSGIIVEKGQSYDTNHFVAGVGYYHGNTRKWYPLPWNDYQEGRGYFRDGAWYQDAGGDQVSSIPDDATVDGVNAAWRASSMSYPDTVINGFGNVETKRRSGG